MLPSTETEALGEARVARKLVFHRVAENLYRLETNGGYYALIKRGDKQFRRSLKPRTANWPTADWSSFVPRWETSRLERMRGFLSTTLPNDGRLQPNKG
jgi:hypothetical protein